MFLARFVQTCAHNAAKDGLSQSRKLQHVGLPRVSSEIAALAVGKSRGKWPAGMRPLHIRALNLERKPSALNEVIPDASGIFYATHTYSYSVIFVISPSRIYNHPSS